VSKCTSIDPHEHVAISDGPDFLSNQKALADGVTTDVFVLIGLCTLGMESARVGIA
jgi:hypothetical protein